MWTEVDRFVDKHGMLKGVSRIVIGLSGGTDSVCLARYLLHLREKGGPDITAVHINHMLRGAEAERDEEFVRRFCRQWEIPLFVFCRDVRELGMEYKMSLEEAGRKVRYECFREVMEKQGGEKTVRLAVAHHADDLAETMIFRMIRGTGPQGLIAMRPVQGDLIRPFLHLRKHHLLSILHALRQDFVEDASNRETDYSRNYIRHHLLPAMERLNPRAVEHLCSLSEQEADLFSFLKPQTQALIEGMIESTPEGFCVDVKETLTQAEYVRRELIRRLFFLASGHEKDFGAVHVDQVMDLLYNVDGKRIDLPQKVIALRRDGRLILAGKTARANYDGGKTPEKEHPLCRRIELPEYREGKKWKIILDEGPVLSMRYEAYHEHQFLKGDCEKYFDYDTIKHELFLRTRRQGDYFVFNAQGKRKRLSRYFIDSKIQKEDRDRQLLLTEDSHVLWIVGGRISEACKISPKTERMLVVSLSTVPTSI